ncbi:MAG: hypothetical protein HY048_00685 [Acidobacteria bacterium]|nr:hypothetical protein [Acidobacteriota bacterium]
MAAVVVALAFWRAFGLFRFYDDWYFAREADRAVRDHAFLPFLVTPAAQHWSPLWQAFDYLNAWTMGWQSDALIRSAIVVMVIAGLRVFGRLMMRLQLTIGATAVGLGVLGLHHMNAIAYYSFDCYSQIAADLCTWSSVSLVLGDAIADRDAPPGRGRAVAPVLLFTAGVLIKEQALAALAGVTLLAVWFTVVERADADRRRTVLGVWAAMVVVGVTFALLRFMAGRWLAQPYPLCIVCVPGNLAMFLGALALPAPTVVAYHALMNPTSNAATVAIVGLGAALVCGFVGLGIAASGRARHATLITGLAVVTLFPIALLARVGELHAHTAVFWYAALVAFAVDGWAAKLRTAGRHRVGLFAVLAVLYIAVLLTSLRINLGEMRVTGERAASLLSAFRAAARDLPAGSVVLARGLENVKAPGDHSLYRLTTAGMLLYEGDASLQFVSPPGVTVVDERDWPDVGAGMKRPAGPRTYVADFRGGAVSVRERPPQMP